MEKKTHHCNKQQIRHSKSSSHTSVKWWIVRVPCLHGCCNFGSLMLPYQRSWPMMPQNPQYSLIHWTQYFFFLGGGGAKVNQVHSGSMAKFPKAIQNLQHNARTRERKCWWNFIMLLCKGNLYDEFELEESQQSQKMIATKMEFVFPKTCGMWVGG